MAARIAAVEVVLVAGVAKVASAKIGNRGVGSDAAKATPEIAVLAWKLSPSLQCSNRFVYIRKQRAAVRELTLLLSADYGLPEDSVNVQYVRVVRKHASQVVRGNVEVFQRKPQLTRYHCPEQLR